MTNEGDKEVLINKDGNPDGVNGADVTLALMVRNPDGVEV